ncbi:multidrug effflux MFS transporter [Pseudomonas sp. UL073]|uniref:Bcr/CflA family efflux transporter n=1 Tax=Zestomonas insulae TaxID=2809017 RepID=A0ABS2I8M4_9GAMM|nr:multidrug effflux MFS transporter [Pseudomonas insulae]MBM7059307.1 multidrug effflux MFS transporter [Pseudomonas insulae]
MRLSLRASWLVLLGALTAIAPMSTDMYLPAFPAITRALQLAPGGVELSFSSYFVGVLLGMLCYGPLSDRYGRKPPLYFGLALYSLASLAIVQAASLESLVGWRFLQGIGGCTGTVLTTAIVRDRCTPQDTARVLSRIMLVMGLAPILAPLGGGLLLAVWGWQAIFLVLAAFGLSCLLAVHLLLDETLTAERVQPLHLGLVLRRYARLCGDRQFLGYLLSQAFAAGAMFAYIAGSPFVLLELQGIEPSHYGLFFGLNGIGLLLASQFNRRLLRRYSASLLLARALWLPLGAGALLLSAELAGLRSLPLLMLGFFVLVASIGVINPNASAMAMVSQGDNAGVAAAMLGATTFGMGMLGGVFIGLAHDGSGLPLALAISALGTAAWLANRLLLGTWRVADGAPA